jgi:hypothetical protein
MNVIQPPHMNRAGMGTVSVCIWRIIGKYVTMLLRLLTVSMRPLPDATGRLPCTPQAVEHARHTKEKGRYCERPFKLRFFLP